MEEIWDQEKLKQSVIRIGTGQYQRSALFDTDPEHIFTKQEKPVLYPCQYGGLLMRMGMNGHAEIILNNGRRYFTVLRTELKDIRTVFWCDEGNIGFLHYRGAITVCSTSNEILKTIPTMDDSIIQCSYQLPTGIIFVTDKGNVMIFESRSMSLYKYATLPTGSYVQSIAYADDKAFVCMGQNEIFLVTPEQAQPIEQLPFGAHELYVDYHCHILAATDSHNLYIRQLDTSSRVMINSPETIYNIAFVDSQTVAFYTETHTLQFFKPGMKQPVVDNATTLYIAQNTEGIRIYQEDKVSILLPVDQTILALYQKQYNETLKNLIRAKECYDKEEIESFKLLTKIHHTVEALVLAILEAAPHILDISISEKLLVLAAFAKYQIDNFDQHKIENVNTQIRILYSLRTRGFFTILANDLMMAEPKSLLNTIIQMDNNSKSDRRICYIHEGAAICRMIRHNPSIVAQHWANMMLSTYKASAIDTILRRLNNYDQIDFYRLAKSAKFYGMEKRHVKEFANFIRDPESKMNFMMNEIQDNEDVVQDVLSCKDGNTLIQFLYMKKLFSKENVFYSYISNYPILQDHYCLYKKYIDSTKMRMIPGYSLIKYACINLIHFNNVPTDFGKNNAQLEAMKSQLDKSSIWHIILENHISILNKMNNSPEIRGRTFNEAPIPSPREIIRRAIILDVKHAPDDKFNYNKFIKEVKKSMQIPDRTICWIKIRTYLELRFTKQLADMANSSQPLPWDIIANECYNAGQPDLTKIFIGKVNKLENRFNLYKDYKFYEEAAKAAKSMKNEQLANEMAMLARQQG